MISYPIFTFGRIDDDVADARLVEWGHWLGACNRPFGRQSFGLTYCGELVSVAVSASTVNASCGGWPRNQVVELARQCSHPLHRDLTRVMVRLWRIFAPRAWSHQYWPVKAVVSYSNRNRHSGDIYRFDGWKKIKDVPGGRAGVNTGDGRGPGRGWTRPRKNYEPKSVWVFQTPEPPEASQSTIAAASPALSPGSILIAGRDPEDPHSEHDSRKEKK